MKFNRLENLIGALSLEKLKNSTILVIGLGGVGGYVVEALARSGIGNLILVDYDIVDITNFNRQIVAINDNIGKYKVDCFKERIESINEECNVTIYNLKIDNDNIKDIFNAKIDFVIDSVDDIRAKVSIINYCLEHNIDFISSMGTGNRLDPSKLTITTLNKTYNDPLARIIRSKFDKNIQKKITVCLSLELPLKVTDKTVIGSNAFVPSSAGLLIASHIIRKINETK
ncbi:MAG TPA: tRNA threonylcarbamoyladenosine dehydratase [Candidatus Onthousia faecipullorum]|uniref:tRNA threonylcarbamoyladenosine dehydratase n=1 Tax=Candidatus Onthousia faecipullorum TaxID=2840887 RepID=A0A9D1GA13_9FIRM|nr:tRNA threonylcarbamoyladenosine dehydratase [Candidatus Onthousia faecipullorum]